MGSGIQKISSKPQVKEGARNNILAFESLLKKQPNAKFGDNDMCPLRHSFANGIYVREIFIPKGAILTGKIHKHEHPNFLLKGSVTVFTENGGVEHLKAPLSMISPAGTKRVVYANTDVIWVTCHNVGNETDLKVIEKEVIAESYEELDTLQWANKTGLLK